MVNELEQNFSFTLKAPAVKKLDVVVKFDNTILLLFVLCWQLFETGGKAMFGVGNRRTQGVREFQEYVKLLEKELRLKGKDFFGGDAIGYVDIAAIIVPFVFGKSQELVGVELLSENKFPSIFKWAEKIYSMDLFNKCYPPKEKHLGYMRAQIVASKVQKEEPENSET